MNEDVVPVIALLREHFAIVAIEPGVDRVLIEDLILNLELQLVAQEGVAAAGVDHHLRANAHFPLLRPMLNRTIGSLGPKSTELTLTPSYTVAPSLLACCSSIRSNLPRSTW